MKNRNILFIFIFLTFMIILDLTLYDYCKELGSLNNLLDMNKTLDSIRNHEITVEQYENFMKWEKEEVNSCYDYMCAYFISGETDKKHLNTIIEHLKEYKEEEFEQLKSYLSAIWEDLKYFPVPTSTRNEDATVSFVNSWMAERTFGGKRGHEGTDIMAGMNQRGYYPIVSMTDGVVEQIGWLTQGGYRIGIRSPHGGYFYYAHLYDYAKGFEPGDTVKAGEIIGFMGDSGYSEVEGTVGNFDVHLHLGIYINLSDGTEISINSYAPLVFLQSRKLEYEFY